jgi:hypothetical protein
VERDRRPRSEEVRQEERDRRLLREDTQDRRLLREEVRLDRRPRKAVAAAEGKSAA